VILPATCAILVALFLLQKHGTGRIGALFGPIMIFWFVTLAILGLIHIWDSPRILAAIDPRHAVTFFLDNGLHGMVVLGSVVLCITGAEALYPTWPLRPPAIRLSWNGLVLPSLLLNYFGQGPCCSPSGAPATLLPDGPHALSLPGHLAAGPRSSPPGHDLRAFS
jgi:KUP system potassium uptake protein